MGLDVSRIRYSAKNKCIYCQSDADLQDEHIIPYGLNGPVVFPKSTCKSCAVITSKFEEKVLRGPMRDVRFVQKFRSRSGYKGMESYATISIKKNGKEEIVDIPLEKFPIPLFFPIFPLPAYINSNDYGHPNVTGIILSGAHIVRFGPNPADMLRGLGAKEATFESQKYDPVAFAKMIAKIAFGFAIAEGFVDKIEDTSPLVSSILGKTNDIGKWVGTLPPPIRVYNELWHRLAFYEDKKLDVLEAEVQLFANSQTPSYLVIVGKLKH